MKIILVCILSFLLAFNLFSADKKTYSEEYVVKGKVQERVEICYYVKNLRGKDVKEAGVKNVYKYDEKDRMIDVETDHAVSKHDDKGNQTEEALYNAKGDLLQKFIYKYDDRGRLIEELYYSPEEMISETVAIRDEIYTQRFYRYNEKDNMVERDKCYSHGCLFEKSIFKYDDKGNVIEEARYDEKGTLTSIDVSSYTYY